MKQAKVPDYEPSDRQTKFHVSTAFETLYGGAAGGGKSAAICAEAVTSALEAKGTRVYIFRKTIPELKQSIVPEMMKQCADYINAGHMHYNGQDRQFRFKNGSIIQLAYCDNPGDVYKYQSAEIHLLLIDELTHFSFDEYEYLKTRVRSAEPRRLRIMAATNPGNVGHGWVKSYFIDVAEPETLHTESGQTRIFIPAKVSDHPVESFRDSYRKSLEAIADADLKRALLEGDWDVFAGQVFTEWRRDKHVVTPFAIPEYWPKWLGYDHGYNTKAAALWFAKDPQANRTYVYRELYETEKGVNELARLIKLMQGQEVVAPRMADPAIWKGAGNQNTGETVADMFVREGISFTPANNDRIAGKQAWHEALSIAPDGLPKLQVFENCIELIRTLPSLPYDLHRVEDVDTDAEDHLYDAGRYGLVNQRPAKVPKVYTPKTTLRNKVRL